LALSTNGLYCALSNPKYSVIEIIALESLKLLLQIPAKGDVKFAKFSSDSQVNNTPFIKVYEFKLLFVLVGDNINLYAVSSGEFLSSTFVEGVNTLDIMNVGIVFVGTTAGLIQLWDFTGEHPHIFQVS
jgi:hypothetical protein